MTNPASNSVPNPRPRIICCGDVIDDVIVVPLETIRVDTDTTSSIRFVPGGSAANTASWLGVSGAAVDFVGRVASGDVHRHGELLSRCGVTVHLAPHDTLPTGTIVIIVEGETRTMLTESGANAELDTRDVTDALLAEASVLYLTGYTLFNRPDTGAFTELIARAVASGVTVAIDPGSAGFITDFGVDRFLEAVAGVSIFLPNLDEGQLLTGLVDPAEVAAALTEFFPVVALTMDVDGIVVAERGSAPISVAVAHTAAVDPTGAGDSFSAGFLHEWMASGDVALAATAGAALAARAVSTIGARPQV